MNATNKELQPFFAKLCRLGELAREDERALLDLPWSIKNVNDGAFLARQNGKVTHCHVLLSGLATRDRLTGTGARQITGFFFAGDLVDLGQAILQQASDTIQAFSSAVVAEVPTQPLLSLIAMRPGLNQLFFIDAMLDAAISREWLLSVGRRDARTKLLHLICEFAVRQQLAGALKGNELSIPFTQEQLGDTLGLTAVHVNRVFSAFRLDVAVERLGRTIRIKDWQLLRQLADFDDAYLRPATSIQIAAERSA